MVELWRTFTDSHLGTTLHIFNNIYHTYLVLMRQGTQSHKIVFSLYFSHVCLCRVSQSLSDQSTLLCLDPNTLLHVRWQEYKQYFINHTYTISAYMFQESD